ncbi:interferon lambda-3-like [Pipra filicauda]|uniref:Interferon lambda-3-like n=1 Tax=Pipra filicauda TaxID=649802 RepID=A0A6J2HVG4_9PASS|nr:interferon lambda-3-like [Pipra filicauda]
MLCLHLTSLLVLVLGVSLGAAFPHNTLRKGCSLFKYKQVTFDEKKAVKKMQKEFRSIRQPGRNCDTGLLDRKWMSAHLSVPDRVVLVEAELNFTITMLQLSTHPGFTKMRQRPLAFLAQAREDLRGCVAPSHQPSGELSRWLQNLQVAMNMALSPPHENTGCLQDYAVRHVFEVLEDLNCAALQEQCS